MVYVKVFNTSNQNLQKYHPISVRIAIIHRKKKDSKYYQWIKEKKSLYTVDGIENWSVIVKPKIDSPQKINNSRLSL